MKLIVGLGNPGKEYANTRHNVGFIFADRAIGDWRLPAFSPTAKLKAEISQGEVGGKKIILAKPQTFMNISGAAVRTLAAFYKIKPAEIIVVHDDKDIPLGEYRIQKDRGPAGHNGVKSIIESLGTKNFTRVRIGIKPARAIKDTAEFVLKKMPKAEQDKINSALTEIIKKIFGL
ncbi:MAG: aminoacyl-tRNA hydrolase [Patescibacteria group bacterium]|nr:aminoacyl-tRNA hydrolase [Patescibacteria group bacterium]